MVSRNTDNENLGNYAMLEPIWLRIDTSIGMGIAAQARMAAWKT